MMTINAQALDRCIREHDDPTPFAGVVQITQGEEVLFQGAYGQANRADVLLNHMDTRFQMASGCKVFTAVAICQLVEQGYLRFDTPLLELINVEAPHWERTITVGHLLTHSSGITSYFEEDVDDDYEALWQECPMYRMRGPRDFLPLFQNKPMKFAPGSRFEYNDGGFILLGVVVEAVTARPFADYVQEQVLSLVGMTDSGYFALDRLPARTAYSYIQDEDGSWRTNFYAVPVIGGADGGAFTTAADMARFWQALRGNRLLGAEMTRTMLTAQIATGWKAPFTHYGYGVWLHQDEVGPRRLFVEGADPGVAMRSQVYVQDDLTLTLLANTERALWRLLPKVEALIQG